MSTTALASPQGPPGPRPTRPLLAARWLYRLQRLLRPNAFYRWLARRIESAPRLYRGFSSAEETVKAKVFGCQMCGQCALPATGYACPMSCPKQLRNGPCGGVGADGGCEVYPEMRCVWLVAWERASQQRRGADLCRLQRPVDQRLWGQSSWVNYWQDRDSDLWTDDDGLDDPPELLPLARSVGP
jgi:Methylene-tetrahydrofolate reductase C terminal